MKGDSAYTKTSREKISLEEAQALIASKFAEQEAKYLVPVRVTARWAMMAALAGLVISLAAFVVAVVR